MPGGTKSRKGSVEGRWIGFGDCTAIRRVEAELDEGRKGNHKRTLVRVVRTVASGISDAEERQGLTQSEPFLSTGL